VSQTQLVNILFYLQGLNKIIYLEFVFDSLFYPYNCIQHNGGWLTYRDLLLILGHYMLYLWWTALALGWVFLTASYVSLSVLFHQYLILFLRLYDTIYLLTAIVLSPGGSTHLHVNTT
jgi:hypothetical protein